MHSSIRKNIFERLYVFLFMSSFAFTIFKVLYVANANEKGKESSFSAADEAIDERS